jgi:glycosyltransferase involved in cell wall biosynthesis
VRLPPALRAEVLDEAVLAGDTDAAGLVLDDLASAPRAGRAGSPDAVRRAAAIEVAASRVPAPQRAIELAVAAYLRGAYAAPRSAHAATMPAGDAARSAADRLRLAGHHQPAIVVNFPGFRNNPYSTLMEQAYADAGMAALHVHRALDIDAVVAGGPASGYRTIVHANAPNRFLQPDTPSDGDLSSGDALRRIDAWLDAGASLVWTIHNGPRLSGPRGLDEQIVAQGIADRAVLVHILTASTPAVLDGWVRLDASRTIHVAHPSYDGAYPDPPARDEARRRIGLDTGQGADGVLVAGMIGYLGERKHGSLLLDALDRVPEPMPDGRGLRLVIGGPLAAGRHEPLIRRALADPRVITRLGFMPDAEMVAIVGALDVAVLSYQQLNSAWLHLALTHGVPAIAPAGGTAREVVRPGALREFHDGDPSSLASALAGAGSLANPQARALARSSITHLVARALSERLASAIRAAAEGGSEGAPEAAVDGVATGGVVEPDGVPTMGRCD